MVETLTSAPTSAPAQSSRRFVVEQEDSDYAKLYGRYTYRFIGSFLTFQGAWAHTNAMLAGDNHNITGCHYDPDALSPSAEFTTEHEATIKHYRIREVR